MSVKKISIIAVGAIAFLGFALYSSIDPVVYRLVGWWSCRDSRLLVCNPANAQTPKDIASGNNGVVVSTQQEASEIGLQVLQDGGNAIDAAVAVGYALAVSDPCCGNIGGGGFMLIRFADGESTFIDFRETAPNGATEDMYLDESGKLIEGLSTQGYLAVGVPGTVKGLNYALREYGTMQRDRLIQPAIRLAKNGFTLQRGDVKIFQAKKRKLLEPNVAEIFLTEDNQVYQPGDLLIQTDLARTLEAIAEQGTEAFYQGDIAKKIVAASAANGGILSLEDFANYQIRERQPVNCSYRGYLVITAPPPGGGTTVCQMLNILSGYDLEQLGWRTPKSLHYIFSAMLLAFGDRNYYLGDPDFVEFPLDKLLSKNYGAVLRAKIPTNRAITPESVYANLQSEGSNTTHYSVVDREGNAVAVTYTINSYFGAGVVAPGTGFLLNNEMDDFTSKLGKPNQFGLRQGEANLIKPGKRPLSSMSPTVVTKNGKVYLVTGSPGGSTIPTTVLQVIINAIDYDMDLEAAVNTPRLHYQGFPNRVFSEPRAIDTDTRRSLKDFGYKILPFDTWGAAESIMVDPETGRLTGVNDKRKPAGKAAAY